MPPSAPLPRTRNLFERDEAATKAYARLLHLENHQELLIRILGQMLIQAPLSVGRDYLARIINNSTSNQMIFNIGQFYLNQFIGYFKSVSEASRTPSANNSRPSFTPTKHKTPDLLAPAAKHVEAKKLALARDNYRCMLSGTVDTLSIPLIPRLIDEVMDVPEILVKDTECCHILPQYVNHGLTQGFQLPETVTTFWTIAHLFGGIPDGELEGSGTHDLRNLMTLETSVRNSFEKLEIWLEPIKGTTNQYNLGKREFYTRRDLPSSVTFSSTSDNLPLPDPRYLALHAACARVIQATDAYGYIVGVLRDAEEARVLAEDGSSGELLNHLLPGDSFVVF